MRFETPWLIALGLTFHSTLYYLSRAYLAQWLRGALLRWKTRANSTPNQGSGDETPTEGQLAEMAQLIVGVVFACTASVFSVIIMVQTKDDVINQQSWVLVPFAHWGAWYYLIDLYTIFVKRRWSILTHHLLLLCVAYPLAVSPSVRGGKGDFVLGALIAEEWSTPFLSTVKILRMFELDKSLIYRLTGLSLLLTFFLARVANLPLVTLLYAAQHHDWSLPAALTSMTPVCHFFNSIQLLLQTYWFLSLLRIAAVSHRNRRSTTHHKPD